MSQPLFLLGLCALVLNDNWLKGHAPAWLTGKLSDVAFLVVAPCVLVVLLPSAWVQARRAAFAALEARPVSPQSCKGIAASYEAAVQASTLTCDVDADCVGVIGFATTERSSCSVYFNKGSRAAAEAETLTNSWASKRCFGGTACVPTAPAQCIGGQCRAGCTTRLGPLPTCPVTPPSTADTAAPLPPECPFACYSPPSNPLQPPPPPLPNLPVPADASPPPDACPYSGVASAFCAR